VPGSSPDPMSSRVGVVSAWLGAGTAAGPGRSGEGWEIRARASSSRRVVRTSHRDVAVLKVAPQGGVVNVARDRPVDRQPAKWCPAALDSAVRYAGLEHACGLGTGGVYPMGVHAGPFELKNLRG